ncbi:MAG TPA: hypothetical protein VG367_11035 [Mucilaginibacter sp.]|jgi:hypothetical protein|nr:hypothetical protein [Mucilaginibacter sp.]
MAGASINNIDELRAEIARLRVVKEEQGKAIARRFNTPMTTLSTLYSMFPRDPEADSKSSIFGQDFFGLLSRILLPLTLNKTLFRNSNFLVKGLVGLLSQKASHFINEDTLTGIWDKVRSLLNKKDKQEDYGIPPESEAS